MRGRSVAGVAAAALLLATGCGGSGDGSAGGLIWAKGPLVFRNGQLPHDRVAGGTLKNTSKRPVHLIARRARIRDADSHLLQSTTQFKQAYAHGLYGAFQQPQPLPREELIRLGFIVTIPPGSEAPVTLAYRLRRDSKLPVSVEFGPGKPLELPSQTRPGAR